MYPKFIQNHKKGGRVTARIIKITKRTIKAGTWGEETKSFLYLSCDPISHTE